MNFEAEMNFLSEIFESDSKNYHAWSYRVWLVERFSLWEGELEYVESLLDREVTNNSAWSYRYFILNRQPNSEAGSHEYIRAEIDYVFDRRLKQDINNEAAWVYLRGLYCVDEAEENNQRIKRVALKHLIPSLQPRIKDLTTNRFAIMCMIDICKV